MKITKTIIVLLLVLSGCTGKKDLSNRRNNLSEEDFYRAFTDATKHALLGNYKNAINLYQLCIREYPERAASYFQVSNIYLTVNDIERAKNYAIKAAEREEDNKWYLLHLANIYQYENNLDSLIVLYEKVTKITSEPEYKYNLALFYSAAGRNIESLDIVYELDKVVPDSREVMVLKHRNYAAMEVQDSAIYALESLIYLFPDQFENYGMLAEYLSEINLYERSRVVYRDLLEREPDNGLANLSYGDFFLKQGKKDSALVFYTNGFKADDISLEDKIGILFNYMYDETNASDTAFIIELVEVLSEKYNDPTPYSLTAELYLKQQNYEKAAVELKKAIDMGSDNYVIWEQYLMISNFNENHEQVREIYTKALEMFPKEVNLYIFSGYSLYMLERHDEIIAMQDSVMAIESIVDEQKVQYLNLLADAYRGMEDYATSDSIYEEILVIDPNNLLIRNNYSYYLAVQEKDLEKAEELSRLTIVKEPKNATYLDTYGWILFKQGKYKEASKYIESAIKNGAYNNAEVLDHYGDVMLKLDRCKEAIEAWTEALKYDEGLGDILNKKIETLNDRGCN